MSPANTLLRAIITGFGLKVGAELYRVISDRVASRREREEGENAEDTDIDAASKSS